MPKDSPFKQKKFINCLGSLIDLSTPKVMGIINLTANSFYAESRAKQEKQVLQLTEKHLEEGAHFLDIGAQSTRPGAKIGEESDETNAILWATKLILQHFSDAIISVDTFRSETAKKAVDAGAAIINDVSGGNLDEMMFETLAQLKVPYILMHMRGTSETMKELNDYDHLTVDINFELSEKLNRLRQLGVTDVIIDPGFGFAKNIKQNFALLKYLEDFKLLNCPILVGVSRKSMIYKTLDISVQDALNGTTVLNTIALQNGANILRVHDVKEAIQTIKLTNQLEAAKL